MKPAVLVALVLAAVLVLGGAAWAARRTGAQLERGAFPPLDIRSEGGLAPLDMAQVEYVQARYCTKGNGRRVDVVVLHTAESPESPTAANALARYFATMEDGRQASAHYVVDSLRVVQCVDEADVAWHAPGCNAVAVGVEHAGYAKQDAADWADDYSRATLELSARLVAGICQRWGVPIEFLDADGLKAKRRGITTHAEVSRAFPAQGNHTDPGAAFPLEAYLAQVRSVRREGQA